ncbi:MAG: PD-(D/E)XK nuclease family protein [Candidatus Delongbacteria bacterium]|nr:PD-(D/E)XK nuclease family protein [Candidatus Delongbacteria bacterium]MBN2834002.1 PD-(D/E)XK nuclease family protein [Candidatus Delongbacteria bacterium]
MTEKIQQYKEQFDTELWSERRAKSLGVTPSVVIDEWEENTRKANEKGSFFHKFAELKISNKLFDCNIDSRLKEQFYKFLEDSSKNLFPVKSEMVIGDLDLSIAGTIDQLYWSEKKGGLVIFDWKTNKNFTSSSKYGKKMLKPLDDLEESHINLYSLQLNIYKYIFEKNTGLKIIDLYLVWFNENNNDYIIYRCKDLMHKVKTILGV